jgi:hypothetical protein
MTLGLSLVGCADQERRRAKAAEVAAGSAGIAALQPKVGSRGLAEGTAAARLGTPRGPRAPQLRPAELRQKARADLSYQTVRGYVVQGSDESSFRPCGSSKVYFIHGPAEPKFVLTQRYRYLAFAPLVPIYFELSAAYTDSTINIGPNTYTAIAFVKSVGDGDKPPANCPRPGRGSMIAKDRLLS